MLNLDFAQHAMPSQRMDVVHDVGRSILLKLYQNFKAKVMAYWQLKLGEACGGYHPKSSMGIPWYIRVPFRRYTNEDSLEEVKSHKILNYVVGGMPQIE